MNRWWRCIQHGWLGQGRAQRALSPAAVQALTEHVRTSEQRHTGEVCVCVESVLPLVDVWPPVADQHLPVVVRQRALAWFGQMRVWDTQHNNGVLIYLQWAERRLEIVADRGLNDKVSAAQWQALTDGLALQLRQGHAEVGLHAALDQVSTWLQLHFPADPLHPKPNELPDAVVVI